MLCAGGFRSSCGFWDEYAVWISELERSRQGTQARPVTSSFSEQDMLSTTLTTCWCCDAARRRARRETYPSTAANAARSTLVKPSLALAALTIPESWSTGARVSTLKLVSPTHGVGSCLCSLRCSHDVPQWPWPLVLLLLRRDGRAA
eukprot:SAG31_NODE_27_length_32731_cov_1443.130393_8_plen_147_part_00